ncbi:MAG: transcriptional repressor [Faecalibacterium sp.]|nr:transcriptional repressor [Ruminococcus sp.]MCM1393067.1 transcriptional repressor [Ruminococcus sp.]MCM1484708.1 transcriptional repressor [Faecalibacterium sp.]
MADSVYKTKQREVILECLKEHMEQAYTIDEITQMLKEKGESVGRTTVYRYIDFLAENGKVRKFLSANGKSATYQFIEHYDDCCEHMHLKCVECGKFVHLGCDFMSGVCSHIMEHHNFKVDNSKTTILGICKECMSKGDSQ